MTSDPGTHSTVVVLAAGRGTRMGGPKALMSVNGAPWWRAQRDRLAGRRAVWVVSPTVRPSLEGLECAEASSESPMFESVRVGVENALRDPRCRGVFVLPVDVPAPGDTVFAALEQAGQDGPALPAHRGERGHPVYLPRAWAERVILAASGDPALRLDALMKPTETIVDVDDPAVTLNLNTPEDRVRFEKASGGDARNTAELEEFLAERDAPCPSCQYNLRGVAANRCPECGKGIALGIVGTRPRSAVGFILLALAWVLLAAGMNASRQGYIAYQQGKAAARPPVRMVTFASSSSFTFNGSTTSTTTRTNPDGSTTTIKTLPSGQTVTTTTGGKGTPAAPPPTFVWGGIQNTVWVQLCWWGGLGLFAALGLLTLGFMAWRGRTLQRTGTRVMLTWAATLFVLYGGYHAVNFVREVMTW